MKITPIKTKKIVVGDKLFDILDSSIKTLEEKSVVAIASKIISICEGNVVKTEETDKDELIKSQADLYIPKEKNKYNFFLTIKNGLMVASAGVDESNGNGYYVLWPKNLQESANQIREHLLKKFGLKYLGVIITDGKVNPMRRGVTGAGIAHSGFEALNNYIEHPDVFGHYLRVTKANVMDSLAVSAVAVGGEGSEQTPVVIIEDLPFVKFQDRNPTYEETEDLKIPMDEDLYSGILTSVEWEKGGGK